MTRAFALALLAVPWTGCFTGFHSVLVVPHAPGATGLAAERCQQHCVAAFGRAATRGCSAQAEPRALVCIYETPREPPLRPRHADCAAACAAALQGGVASCQAVRTATGADAFVCRSRAPFY